MADVRSESPGETLTRELISRLRIRPPEPQVEVMSRIGKHRLDFAWKEDKVLFEEGRREKALTGEGWLFVRIEWKDLFNEAQFKSRVLRALAARRYAP